MRLSKQTIGSAMLVAAALAVAVFVARSGGGAARPRVSAVYYPPERSPVSDPLAIGPSDPLAVTPMNAERLQDYLDQLKVYRVERSNEAADRLRSEIVAALDQDKVSITNAFLLRLKKEFIGRVCSSYGEARFYDDLGVIGSQLAGGSRESGIATLSTLETLLGRGASEEHRFYDGQVGDPPDTRAHSECGACSYLLLTASLPDGHVSRERGLNLLRTEWAEACPIMAEALFFFVQHHVPELRLELSEQWANQADPQRMSSAILQAIVNLLRAGKTDTVLAIVSDRGPQMATLVFPAIGRELPPDESLSVLDAFRKYSRESGSPPFLVKEGLRAGYGEWATRHGSERGFPSLIDTVVGRVESAQATGESAAAFDDTRTMMNAVINSMSLGKVRWSGYDEHSYTTLLNRFEATVLEEYSHDDRRISSAQLFALGHLARSPKDYFDIAEAVLSLPRVRRSFGDVLRGLRTLETRGMLAETRWRGAGIALLTRLAKKVHRPDDIAALCSCALAMHATDLLDDLRVIQTRFERDKREYGWKADVIDTLRRAITKLEESR